MAPAAAQRVSRVTTNDTTELTELGVGNGEDFVLEFLVARNFIGQELLESLGELSLSNGGHILDGGGGGSESVDSLQLQPVSEKTQLPPVSALLDLSFQ